MQKPCSYFILTTNSSLPAGCVNANWWYLKKMVDCTLLAITLLEPLHYVVSSSLSHQNKLTGHLLDYKGNGCVFPKLEFP
jgi:hypothetical protein